MPPQTMLASPLYMLGQAEDAWVGNYTDAWGVDWIVESEEGWSSTPPIRVDVADRSDADGSVAGPTYFGSRTITLSGRAIAPNNAEMLAAKKRLAVAVPVRDPGDFPLVVGDTWGDLKFAYVRLSDSIQMTDQGPIAFKWTLTVTADDPRKYENGSVVRVGVTAITGGMTYPMRYAMRYGQQVGGRARLSNPGTAPTWPEFIVRGGFNRGFSLVETTSGARLTYDGQLGENDSIRIVPRTGAATLNESGDVRHRFIERTWWQLAPGAEAEVVLTAVDTYSGDPTVDITWRPASW